MAATDGPGGDAGALNYTVLVPIDYNASMPTGGDSLQTNLNLHYEVCNSTVGVLLAGEADLNCYSRVTSHGCSRRLRWSCS